MGAKRKTANKKSSSKPKSSKLKKAKTKLSKKSVKKKTVTNKIPKVKPSKIKKTLKKKKVAKQSSQGKTEKAWHSGHVKTGIDGFDALFDYGIPNGSTVVVAGGAGCGKTIFTLQTLYNQAKKGKTCMYMSFEEPEDRLMHHMRKFGWKPDKLIESGNLIVKRFSPFEVTRCVEALLAKAKGELLIDINPVLLPENCKPDLVVVDSLSAVASAFVGREDSYRIYVEQLFRFFEKLGSTNFLITEITKQGSQMYSRFGVEEFLADGVVIMYHVRASSVKQRAIEVVKMRGENHQKRIVAMDINSSGISVFHEREVLGDIDNFDDHYR